MNIFVLGDYNYGDPDTYPFVGELLDNIEKDYGKIERLVTFDENGVCYLGSVWAHDENVKITIADTAGKQKESFLNNSFLRSIVDKHQIDAFLFVFLDHKKELTQFERNVRWFYTRASKAFKKQIIFTNKNILEKAKK